MTTNGAGMASSCSRRMMRWTPASIPNAGDVGEQRRQRGHPGGVDRGLVHARREVIAELLLDAPAGPIRLCGELLQEGLQLLPVRLAGGEPPAPALGPGGNGVRGTPGAVRERVEVGARIRRSIDVAELDALQRRTRGGWRGGCGSRRDRGEAGGEREGRRDEGDDATWGS